MLPHALPPCWAVNKTLPFTRVIYVKINCILYTYTKDKIYIHFYNRCTFSSSKRINLTYTCNTTFAYDMLFFTLIISWGNRIDPTCVCVCGWVCETYIVHNLVGTGLCCALPTCFVHHGAQGGPFLWPWITECGRCVNVHYGMWEVRQCTLRNVGGASMLGHFLFHLKQWLMIAIMECLPKMNYLSGFLHRSNANICFITIDLVRQNRRFGVGLHCFWHSGPNMSSQCWSSRYESYTLIT